MGSVIDISEPQHDRIKALLPWYVTGRLRPEERALVEHHLDGCVICRSDLKFERRLEAQVGDLPIDADRSWERMAATLGVSSAVAQSPKSGRRSWLIGGAIALQTILLLFVVLPFGPLAKPVEYRAMGAPGEVVSRGAVNGDAIVMFQPKASMRDMHDALRSGSARIVDGPTTTDAFVIKIDKSDKSTALRAIKANKSVALAEALH